MSRRNLPFVFLCFVLVQLAILPRAFGQVTDDAQPNVRVNPVIEWNRELLVILRTPGAQPATIHSTRSFAMLHAAIFDAVNAIDRSYHPYALHLSYVPRRASTWAAADQAAHDVLVALYPAFSPSLDLELQQDLDQLPNGKRKTEGVAVGEAAAAAIIALREDDGSSATFPPFVPTSQPGSYQLTPPNFAPADFVQWASVRPFAIDSASEFRPAAPPDLTSDRYTQSFNEVKDFGSAASTLRSTDQTQIGKFWNGNIQDFWNEIAQTAATQHELGILRSAHLFAVLNFALADTAIAFFDAKYTYDLWRPVTAVQMADTDNNPGTEADSTWQPLSVKTAPDPSYPGAHSAVSAAGGWVLREFLGNAIRLDVTSESLPGVTRHFSSFSDAVAEAGVSRIYAGQHFRFDHEEGLHLGDRVAHAVTLSVLQPRRDWR
ncbi:vanadium-dependent haloperoxidase [Occallatibacter riparius]|uniref:Vanadium-dependent haloperoxidase n=1 Tax=Occallatibacter riparius TaxID=1002689 RepID=A0A9J7BRR1_9BACT|nr:vanadium-dependent haloperoxidase [Occallatibacter riparius]UWZ84458.1 vanadium-dependent haloperoxidase [Occallatibacter riparius]